MFWLFLIALMLLIPILAGVQIWRELRVPAPSSPDDTQLA
jgi:hypothetical protein